MSPYDAFSELYMPKAAEDINKGVAPALVEAAQIAAADTQVVYQNYLEAKKNVKIFGKDYVESAKQSYLLSKEVSTGINATLQEARNLSKNKKIDTTNTNNEIIVRGSRESSNITATPAVPEIVPAMRMFSAETAPVKTATPDIVLFNDETVPIEVMEDLLFENIGGQELINIARSDTINGQSVSYQPIKNISAIQQQYNPNNIVSLQQTSNKFFAGFSIKLEDKIPSEGNGSNGSNIYIDPNNGNLTIELIKLETDEQVEIQIVTNGTIYEDTVEGFTS